MYDLPCKRLQIFMNMTALGAGGEKVLSGLNNLLSRMSFNALILPVHFH